MLDNNVDRYIKDVSIVSEWVMDAVFLLKICLGNV